MFEKRRHQRLSVDLPVTLRYKGRLLPATALNISCGGMSIRAEDRNILNNEQVEIIFDLGENQKDLSVRGKVIRVEEADKSADLGVQFTNVFSVSHKAILEYLGKNLN